MRSIIELYEGRTIVGVGAHPDDLEAGMGGTLARLADAGAEVVMVVASVPTSLSERTREAERGAAILGGRCILLEPDRCQRIEDLPMHELVGRLDRVVRELEPAAVFTHASDDTHYDHVLVHRAVLSTTRLRPMDAYVFGPSGSKTVVCGWQPRIWVDVSATIERKLEAIAAHESQFGRRGIDVERFRRYAQAQGLAAGMSHAEGLDVLCMRG